MILGSCVWKGIASEWLNHCIDAHKDKVTDLPFVTFSEPWSPKHKDPIMRYHLMRCYQKVFSVYQIYDGKSGYFFNVNFIILNADKLNFKFFFIGKMMWTVIAIGDVSEEKSFYFDLEIFNPFNAMRKISFR